MEIIRAPHTNPHFDKPIFLAGGITNCPDWQSDIAALMEDIPGVAMNPRREGEFLDSDSDIQIEWEYNALREAELIMFWFPKETLCPITLFELGAFSHQSDTRLIVGTHPEYARRFDVIKQLSLSRPDIFVHDNLEDMVITYRIREGLIG